MVGDRPLLDARGLTKAFGGARALNEVDLTVLPGEVHGLLGENGSGKSTLIKILAGFHAPDEGELEVRGESVRLPLAPGQFRELGMSFVHQDLGLVETMTLAENVALLAGYPRGSGGLISWRRARGGAAPPRRCHPAGDQGGLPGDRPDCRVHRRREHLP